MSALNRHVLPESASRVWRELQPLLDQGRAREDVFSDWLDLILAIFLSASDNLSRKGFWLNPWTLDGPYHARYKAIVARYSDSDRTPLPSGQLHRAYTALQEGVDRDHADILGALYTHRVCRNVPEQTFTPPCVSLMMAEMAGQSPPASIADPCCGSGTLLIEAGKRFPHAELAGWDVDSYCARMCAVNMLLFGFRATIHEGDALTGALRRSWRARRQLNLPCCLIWECYRRYVVESGRLFRTTAPLIRRHHQAIEIRSARSAP